ncbi:ATP-binding protein [Corynebacterium pelargi]|uniref:Nitrate/nitrite sensor protein NarX n=1 Tax=Corynebacterium pelargi TaxID=1471400 RepID=A0A410WAP6_9CORY|nr:ATP-binding protein [Corynebacterium pelargi]QAU53027.1 nitrate/nitrite sensor protein NarX [Corynebacterium pelargi]GGG75354.1 two-component system sensor kinase [Corynebacterium pelargi]
MITYPAFRRSRDRMLGGVAGGLAEHLGVPAVAVRVFFAAACFATGLGLVLYIALWVLSPLEQHEENAAPQSRVQPAQWLLVALAILGCTVGAGFGFGIALALPVVVILVGAVVVWGASARQSSLKVLLSVFGVVLVCIGVITSLRLWQGPYFFAALSSVLVTLLGAGALALPFARGFLDKLTAEREASAVEAQRVQIANQLHDSVLQTLALIQKRSSEPEVQQLARRQERELRQWLFAPRQEASVFAAIERACAEVEDTFGITITPVLVGEDGPMNSTAAEAVAAAREAMVNAAKHSGEQHCDVYAELIFGELQIFVRDRGTGFDPDVIDPSRHGIHDSIMARIERAGGQAMIRSEQGTEVEIRVAMDQEVAQ